MKEAIIRKDKEAAAQKAQLEELTKMIYDMQAQSNPSQKLVTTPPSEATEAESQDTPKAHNRQEMEGNASTSHGGAGDYV